MAQLRPTRVSDAAPDARPEYGRFLSASGRLLKTGAPRACLAGGLWGLLLLLVLVPASSARAQERIQVAFSAMTGNNTPLWVAGDRGLFERNGLEVTLIYIQGGSRVVAAMMAGDTPIAHVGAAPLVAAKLRGANLVFVAATVNKLLFQLFGARDITTPQELRGKKVSISRFGSGSDYAMRLALKQAGLNPARDVTILQMGGTPVRLAGLENGAVQGTVLLPPDTIIAAQKGFHLLVDLGKSGGQFLNLGVATSRGFIRSHAEIVRRFIRSYVEAIHFFKVDKEESMQILAKHLRMDNPALVADVYDLYRSVFQEKPYVTAGGVGSILDNLRAKYPRVKEIKAASLIDNRFIRALDRDGFIDRLYR